ncbi:MAG: hypothetical protein PHX87_00315 [Candidatus Peribacteraceae bacterium]|nr:hypothetical protein [Candidatus Peribacteraceae bacterium]MDD5741852.1 hypothetical protein [Candidatus Peribacteraceae bacterium]
MPNPPSSTGIPVIPAKRSGKEIYDGIMRAIEPELTTDQIPLMKEKYKDETPEERKARGERYAKAMEEYEKRYAQYLQEQDAKVRSFKIGAIHFAEGKASDGDRQKLKSIESSFGTL